MWSTRPSAHHRRQQADRAVFYHTGYPGGIMGRSIRQRLGGKHPEQLTEKAVERMITRGPLQRSPKLLYVYAGPGQARGAAARGARCRHERRTSEADRACPEPRPARLPTQGRAAQQAIAPAGGVAPVLKPAEGRTETRRAWPLVCHRAAQDAIARVWIRPGRGEITVNNRRWYVFRPPGAADAAHSAVSGSRALQPVRRVLHRHRRWPVRPGWAVPSSRALTYYSRICAAS
jgi:hypothetical protein